MSDHKGYPGEYILLIDLTKHVKITDPADDDLDKFKLFREIIIPADTIVINVKHREVRTSRPGLYNGYTFTIKETGVESWTYYGWALGPNTPENIKKFEEYQNYLIKVSEVEKERLRLWGDIGRLFGPPEDEDEGKIDEIKK